MKRFILTLSLALALAAPVWAQDGPPHGGPMGPHDPEIAEALGLDDATRDQIKEVVEKAHAEMESLMSEVHEARGVLKELLEQESPDMTLVNAQIDVITDFENKLFKKKIASMIEMRALLTPEQREQLHELMKERHKEMKKGHRGGPPFGGRGPHHGGAGPF